MRASQLSVQTWAAVLDGGAGGRPGILVTTDCVASSKPPSVLISVLDGIITSCLQDSQRPSLCLFVVVPG